MGEAKRRRERGHTKEKAIERNLAEALAFIRLEVPDAEPIDHALIDELTASGEHSAEVINAALDNGLLWYSRREHTFIGAPSL